MILSFAGLGTVNNNLFVFVFSQQPPPPPPPAASFAPPPPPPPPAMGEVPSITTTHVKTETKAPSSLPPISDTRSELMDSIRKGVQLKVKNLLVYHTNSF